MSQHTQGNQVPTHGRQADPVRVLMTSDTVGGVWTYALELIRALQPYRVEVALATMGAPLSDAQRSAIQQLTNVRLFESPFKLEWMDDPWDDVDLAGEWLTTLTKKWQPDLVHLNNYAHGALDWRVPVLMVGHSCVLSWWQAVKNTVAPPSWDTYRARVGRGLQAADLVVAPTAAMLAALRTHYADAAHDNSATAGFAWEMVIPNGRSADLFGPQAKQPFLFAAGRLWDEAKNIGALASIAPRVPWPILVAGDTEPPEQKERSVASQLADNVDLLGRLDQGALARRMSQAAIYVLPARYEPFGLSILEAALSGCALVLGDIPSLRENWEGAACFVPPDDTDALFDALLFLTRHDAVRRGYAQRARQRAQRFTPEGMAAAYLHAYQRLLSTDPSFSPLPHALSVQG